MFARFFVDRPIFATVLSMVIVIVGLVALIRLPIAQYPEVAPPMVQVSAIYPGADARDGGRHRGHADRAGSQRRRADALHGVPLHQRRPDVS